MSPISLTDTEQLIRHIVSVSHSLRKPADLDPLMDRIGDARYVLIGEATHGTHEFYVWRNHLTKRLVSEKGFNIIGVEGDWPDCYALNRYVKGYPDAGKSAKDVLRSFNRWPTWMWANWETVAFAEWLRKHNASLAANRRTGFYGLDVYSLWESLESISSYLKKNDPESLPAINKVMACFEPHGVKEGFAYAERTYGLESSCEQLVEDLLSRIQYKRSSYDHDPEEVFSTEQNAVVAVNAERYFHVMLRGGDASWNIRDRHMMETADRLVDFYEKSYGSAKLVIWAHNTHIGDARATDMKRAGLINIGQLAKEEHDAKGVVRVGFGTYEGTVMAAYHWGGEMVKMPLPSARGGSWEDMLRRAGKKSKLLLTSDIGAFTHRVGHRAVGVVYDPDSEYGNYVPTIVPERYDAFMYIDKSQSLHPLHIEPDGMQMPETYPFGV